MSCDANQLPPGSRLQILPPLLTCLPSSARQHRCAAWRRRLHLESCWGPCRHVFFLSFRYPSLIVSVSTSRRSYFREHGGEGKSRHNFSMLKSAALLPRFTFFTLFIIILWTRFNHTTTTESNAVDHFFNYLIIAFRSMQADIRLFLMTMMWSTTSQSHHIRRFSVNGHPLS